MDKCNTCGKEYSPSCEWRQGRCPNHTPMIDSILSDNYKCRFFNLAQSLKQIFTKSKNK